MITNLTNYQLEVADWLVQQYEGELLSETFSIRWSSDGQEKTAVIKDYRGKQIKITLAALEILEQEELIQTIKKEIYEPPKVAGAFGRAKTDTPFIQYPTKKQETGRTYTLRNDIFRARDLYMKRKLTRDAERVLEFMITRPSGMQFATRPELMSALDMSDERYEEVCQFLEDFELIEYRSNMGMLWGDIRPTKRGRQVLHEKSLESLLLMQSPVVSYHLGDRINVTNTGENANIAAGRQSTVAQGLSGEEVTSLFQVVFQKLELLILPDVQKDEVKETVELIEEEIKRGTDANEKALRHYFRTLSKMAPDILDVAIATASNPALGAATIVRKIAEKMKSDAQNSH